MPFQLKQPGPNDPPRPGDDKPVTGGIAPGLNPRTFDRVAIAVPAGAKARIMEEAIRRGCSISSLFRDALAEYLGWPEIAEARPAGRPMDLAKEQIKKEQRERVPIPECVNVPKRRHMRGL